MYNFLTSPPSHSSVREGFVERTDVPLLSITAADVLAMLRLQMAFYREMLENPTWNSSVGCPFILLSKLLTIGTQHLGLKRRHDQCVRTVSESQWRQTRTSSQLSRLFLWWEDAFNTWVSKAAFCFPMHTPNTSLECSTILYDHLIIDCKQRSSWEIMHEFKIYFSMCHIQAPISCHEVPGAIVHLLICSVHFWNWNFFD